MKIVIMSLLVMIGFSACSSKDSHYGSYERAQSTNDKAQSKLR